MTNSIERRYVIVNSIPKARLTKILYVDLIHHKHGFVVEENYRWITSTDTERITGRSVNIAWLTGKKIVTAITFQQAVARLDDIQIKNPSFLQRLKARRWQPIISSVLIDTYITTEHLKVAKWE